MFQYCIYRIQPLYRGICQLNPSLTDTLRGLVAQCYLSYWRLVVLMCRLIMAEICRIWRGHSTGYEEFCLLRCNVLSPLKANRFFGRRCRFRFHCWRRSQVRNSTKQLSFLLVSYWFLPWLIFRYWSWRWNVPPKHRLTFSGLQDVIFQKTTKVFIMGVSWYILKVLISVMGFCVDIIIPTTERKFRYARDLMHVRNCISVTVFIYM
jgi:hypothetical protein